ncbi:MAG: DUF4105 domain-containing protein [Phycisphaerales bacterium]|nr:DUF4105 domain-containing protein [Phycisphaerales bacterium]
MWRVLGLILLLSSMALAGVDGLNGQSADQSLRVYLMTIGPGGLAYERFGHNQIWVHDPQAKTDIAYNYGVFDFEQENFFWRFIQGRMLYQCQAIDAGLIERMYRQANPDLPADIGADYWLAAGYMADGRSVWVQELNLQPAHKRALADFLAWNAHSPNNEYRYDYYRDNCSTRVRDALDGPKVLDGQLRQQLEGQPAQGTYRWHTRRLTQEDVPLYVALYTVLGEGADVAINAWQETFLPVRLMEQLRGLKVKGADGRAQPLVQREYQLYASKLYQEQAQPPRYWWLAGLAIGVGLGGVIVGFSSWGGRKLIWRLVAGGLISAWSLLAGTGGLIQTWAWFTDHVVGYWNENWLQCNPVSLVLAIVVFWVVLPALPSSHGRRGTMSLIAYWCSLMALGLSILGLVIKLLPWFDQANVELICLALPLHAGIFMAIRLRSSRRAQRR